jgi:hypothetical protein
MCNTVGVEHRDNLSCGKITPKELNSIAQGRERSERTLGQKRRYNRTPKRVPQGVKMIARDVEPR